MNETMTSSAAAERSLNLTIQLQQLSAALMNMIVSVDVSAIVTTVTVIKRCDI